MVTTFDKAEQLLKNRFDIVKHHPTHTAADEAYLRGAATMVEALGLDFVQRDDEFVIYEPDTDDALSTSMVDLLAKVRKFLIAYELINDGFLEDSDIYDLKLAQTTVSILMRHADELDKITEND